MYLAKMGVTVRRSTVGGGGGSEMHNKRQFDEKEKQSEANRNIDHERTKLNIDLKHDSFEEAYNREFQDVWERYDGERKAAYDAAMKKFEAGERKTKPNSNSAKGRSDTPWEYYSRNKDFEKNLIVENIFAIGGFDDYNKINELGQETGLTDEEIGSRWETANEILLELASTLEEKYPKMIGVQVDIHNDESYPHLHWRGFYKGEGKNFRQAGPSPYRAMREMEYDHPNDQVNWDKFHDDLRDTATEIMKKHEWDRELKHTRGTKTHEAHREIKLIQHEKLEAINERDQVKAELLQKEETMKFLDKQIEIKTAGLAGEISFDPPKIDRSYHSIDPEKAPEEVIFPGTLKQAAVEKAIGPDYMVVSRKDMEGFKGYIENTNQQQSNHVGRLIHEVDKGHADKTKLFQMANAKEQSISEVDNLVSNLTSQHIKQSKAMKFSHLMNNQRDQELMAMLENVNARLDELAKAREAKIKKLEMENKELKEENKVFRNLIVNVGEKLQAVAKDIMKPIIEKVMQETGLSAMISRIVHQEKEAKEKTLNKTGSTKSKRRIQERKSDNKRER